VPAHRLAATFYEGMSWGASHGLPLQVDGADCIGALHP
jgi:hypothetical protein